MSFEGFKKHAGSLFTAFGLTAAVALTGGCASTSKDHDHDDGTHHHNGLTGKAADGHVHYKAVDGTVRRSSGTLMGGGEWPVGYRHPDHPQHQEKTNKENPAYKPQPH